MTSAYFSMSDCFFNNWAWLYNGSSSPTLRLCSCLVCTSQVCYFLIQCIVDEDEAFGKGKVVVGVLNLIV